VAGVRQLKMLNRSQTLFKRSLLVVSIVAAYLLILRGAISFFHPKFGELLALVNYVAGEKSMFWVFEHISAPTYDFLIHTIWGNATAFFTLLFCIFLLAVVLTQPKTKRGANA
jgi:hypothetical protein